MPLFAFAKIPTRSSDQLLAGSAGASVTTERKTSAVIITLNEAHNLPRCIASLQGVADEILVVDSFSTDGTVALAEELGCRVLQQKFLGHRGQKAFAIEQASYHYILSLDADEALSPKLQQSILAAKKDWTHDGYYLNRLSQIDGRWIHHGGWYPDRKMRLFDRRCYQMGGINPHDRFDPAPGARTRRLKGDLLHYTNDSLDARIATIHQFSSIAAEAFHQAGKKGSWWRILIKPSARFFSEYLLQSGWRDGYYGYFIAKTSAYYVWLREIKLKRLGHC